MRLIKKTACLIGHGFPFSAALLGCCNVEFCEKRLRVVKRGYSEASHEEAGV